MRALCCFALAAGSTIALAGPEWPESGDAGALPASAQPVIGFGTVTKITGELTGVPPLPDRGMPDFQDMYLIRIDNPNMFSASTNPLLNGFSSFGSSLFLFTIDGLGLLANRSIGGGNPASTIFPTSNDGSGAALVAPGLYYLAISGRNSVPTAGGFPIFNFVGGGEISGPDGPGGDDPIDSWFEPGQIGVYEIALTGAVFIEAECAADFDGNGVLNFFDFVAFLNAFDQKDPRSDFNNDGNFDFFDILAFISAFAAGCP